MRSMICWSVSSPRLTSCWISSRIWTEPVFLDSYTLSPCADRTGESLLEGDDPLVRGARAGVTRDADRQQADDHERHQHPHRPALEPGVELRAHAAPVRICWIMLPRPSAVTSLMMPRPHEPIGVDHPRLGHEHDAELVAERELGVVHDRPVTAALGEELVDLFVIAVAHDRVELGAVRAQRRVAARRTRRARGAHGCTARSCG